MKLETDRDEYEWRPLDERKAQDEGVLRRRMTNGELYFQLLSERMGNATLIHGLLFLELDESTGREMLQNRICQAWAALRIKNPILGARVSIDATDANPFLRRVSVDVQSSSKSFRDWAKDTMTVVEIDTDEITIDSIPKTLSCPPLPTSQGDQLLLEVFLPSQKSTVESIALGLWVNHNLFDGVSTRVLLSDLRRFIARPEEQENITPRLYGLTTSLLDPRWEHSNKPQPELAPRSTKEDIKYFPPLLHEEEDSPIVNGYSKLSKSETLEVKAYCHKHHLSTSAFAVAALLIRLILNRYQDFPIPLQSTYSGTVPIDDRPVLTDHRAIGQHLHLDTSQIPIGKILNERTKEEIESDIVETVHQSSVAASQYYTSFRDPYARFKGAQSSEKKVESILLMIMNNQFGDSLASRIVRVYSDAIIDAQSLETDFESTVDGIGSTVRDYFLHLGSQVKSISARTWIFQGQTVLALNMPSCVMQEEAAGQIVQEWKDDMLKVAREKVDKRFRLVF